MFFFEQVNQKEKKKEKDIRPLKEVSAVFEPRPVKTIVFHMYSNSIIAHQKYVLSDIFNFYK